MLLTSERGLELTGGRLRASQSANARALSDAIDAAAGAPGPPVLRTMIVRGQKQDASPLVLDVFTLASRHHTFDSLGYTPRVLVVARASRGADAQKTAIVQTVYGLSSAERHVALLLAEGKTADAIALSRGVAVRTVRAQIRTILAKMGISRQIELVARLNQL